MLKHVLTKSLKGQHFCHYLQNNKYSIRLKQSKYDMNLFNILSSHVFRKLKDFKLKKKGKKEKRNRKRDRCGIVEVKKIRI